MYRKFFKRFLDIVLSLAALIILSPVLLIVAVLVWVKLGGPVIFHQERPGKDGKIFRLYKFRTMLPFQTRSGRVLSEAEWLELLKTEESEVLTDEERLTRFGRFLRASSLDELPELWNILKGEMSIVGPRPLSVLYLPYYTKEEQHRHDVLPGLTGLAQVHGRNSLSWEEKFSYDLKYVKNASFWLDVKIILLTVKKVLIREGIGQGAEAPESLHVQRQRKEKGATR